MGKPIADGQVATTAAAIVTGAIAGGNTNIAVVFSQAISQTDSVTVTMKRQGGTARQIAIATLLVNESLVITGLSLDAGDSLLAVASAHATGVDYMVFGGAGADLDIFTMSAKGERKTVAPTS